MAAGQVRAAEATEMSRGERVTRYVPRRGIVRDILEPDPKGAVVTVDAEAAWCGETIGQSLEQPGCVGLALAVPAQRVEEHRAPVSGRFRQLFIARRAADLEDRGPRE